MMFKQEETWKAKFESASGRGKAGNNQGKPEQGGRK